MVDDGDQGIAHRVEEGFDPVGRGAGTSFDSEYKIPVCIVHRQVAGSGEAERGLGNHEVDRDLPRRRGDRRIHDLQRNPSRGRRREDQSVF